MSTFTTAGARAAENSPPASRQRSEAPQYDRSSAPSTDEPGLDIASLLHFQGRLAGICPDHFGLRWVTAPGQVCFYGARDLWMPFDDVVQFVDISTIAAQPHKGGATVVHRIDEAADEQRVWTSAGTRCPRAGTTAGQGYLLLRRRPDNGVRLAMLSLQRLSPATSSRGPGVDHWPWLRLNLSLSAFRSSFRRAIGLVEGLYDGPDLRLTH